MTDRSGYRERAQKIARSVRGCTTDAQYADLIVQIEDALRDANDRALKQEVASDELPEAAKQRSTHNPTSPSLDVVREALEAAIEKWCNDEHVTDANMRWRLRHQVRAALSSLPVGGG